MQYSNEIIRTAKSYDTTPENVVAIMEICEKYGVQPIGNQFHRNPKDVEEIIKICQEHHVNVNALKTVFRRTVKDVKDILDLCEENHVYVESCLLYKDVNDLKQTIDYVKKFGVRYLRADILAKDLTALKESMPFTKRLGLLQYTVEDSSILNLSKEEIINRTAILMYLNLPVHKVYRYSKQDKLHKAYSYSKEKYEAFLYENGISEKMSELQTELFKARFGLKDEQPSK